VAYSKVLDLYKLHIQEHNFNINNKDNDDDNNDDDDDNNNNNNFNNNDKNNNYNNYNNSKKLLRSKLLAYSGFMNRNLASLSSAILLASLEVSFRISFYCFQFLWSLILIECYIFPFRPLFFCKVNANL
jgi:hypothetical protein